MASKYIKLAEFPICEGKTVVISAINDEQVSIGQKVVFKSGDEQQEIFLRNALILDEAGMTNMIEMLSVAKESLKRIQEVTGSSRV